MRAGHGGNHMRWLRRFFADLLGAHADGVRAIGGLPLLFVLLIGWEFAQHVVEVRIGFFDSVEAGRAAANDPARMALGWVKMISVYVGGFFVIRFLVARRGDAALDPLPAAARRYAPYLLYSLVLFALVFYARSIVPPNGVFAFRTTLGLAQVAVEPLLMPWIVAAATDGSVRGPLASARLTGRWYPWALALFFVGRIPVNAAHQLLNRFAVGQPDHVLWPMLVLDAIVVGLVIAVVPAVSVRVARFVRERRDAGSRAA